MDPDAPRDHPGLVSLANIDAGRVPVNASGSVIRWNLKQLETELEQVGVSP